MTTSQQQRAILHVDMDAFFASVEEHDNPELAGEPVIVGGLGRRGVVSAANYAARKFGIHSAMPTARARRLCPQGCYIRPRIARYREISNQVFQVFSDVTPKIQGLSLDEAFLDVSGSLKLLGSREVIGAQVRDRILEETGLHASVGMAHNKFLAKLASDADKPQGFVSVDPDQVAAFLDPMPIGRLWGIGKKTEPKLRRLGLLTIGQLRVTDVMQLKSVLGNRTGHFLKLARGEDEREVESVQGAKSISQEITFDEDVRDARELLAELQRQAETVMRRVRRQDLSIRTVRLKIRDGAFRTNTRSLTLVAHTTSTRGVYQAAKGLLRQWLKSNTNTPVRLIGMGVAGFEGEEQGEPIKTGPLDTALDEINQRFGDDKLSRGLSFSRTRKKTPPPD